MFGNLQQTTVKPIAIKLHLLDTLHHEVFPTGHIDFSFPKEVAASGQSRRDGKIGQSAAMFPVMGLNPP